MLVLLLVACASVESTPDSGSAFGYYAVSFTLPARVDPEDVVAARLGGVALLDLAVDGDALVGTVQGHREGGSVSLAVDTADESYLFAGAFDYDPPPGGLSTVVAVGASLTMGFQSGALRRRGALNGPAAHFARRTGIYMPLPLVEDFLFAPLVPADIGEPPACAFPDVTAHMAASLADSLPLLGDDGELTLAPARLDPALAPHDLGIAGSNTGDLVDGTEDDFSKQLMAHLVLDPYADLFDDVTESQVERAMSLDPDMVLLFDLLGNDAVDAVLGDTLDPALVRTPEVVGPRLDTLFAAFEGVEVLVGTMPSPTYLPSTRDRVRELLDGGATQDEVDVLLAEIAAATEALNDRLREAVAPYPHVHVVEVSAEVEARAQEGFEVGGTELTMGPMGGLVSLDGLHFTDTGYALLADAFVHAAVEELGLDVLPMDLEAVLAADPNNPDALRDAGFDPDACE